MPETLQDRLPFLKENLTRILNSDNWSAFDKLTHEYFLQDIAHVLRYFPIKKKIAILKRVGPEKAGLMLTEVSPAVCCEITKNLDDGFLSSVISSIHTDDAADIVGRLPEIQRKRILNFLDAEHVAKLMELLKYHPETAGGIMSHHFIKINQKDTIEDAIIKIRTGGHEFLTPRVYVVDDTGVLKGYMPSSHLLNADTKILVKDVMVAHVAKVRPEMDQEEVGHIFTRYDLVTLPVVDDKEKLIGVITIDDVVDVIRAEATEDALKMGGTHSNELENPTVAGTVKARAPWLFASLLGGIAALFVIGQFEDTLSKVVALSAFIPVVMGMGGNAGNQAATVIVRGLSMGFIHTGDLFRVLYREFRVGITLGVAYGSALGIISHIKYFHDFKLLGVVVGLSIISAITMGVTVGTFFPMIFKKLNIDPAVATAPFVATTLDIGGILVYFTLAKSILGI